MLCANCGAIVQILFAFCPSCGSNNLRNIHGKDMDELLRYYFQKGFSYKNILLFLSKYHDTEMCMRTLQQRLHYLGLKRRNVLYNIQEVRREIINNLNGPGCSGGYRSHWHSLRLKGIQVPRRVVEELCRELDPAGCQERKTHRLKRREYRNPGPNFAWHTDGYDKLKPYGFPIHGCIDGFSRKVIWLKVSRTNNDPAVIAGFYLEAVEELGGCPVILRTDTGTENTVIAAVQSYLRCDGQDEHAGAKAHVYGSSHSNQRIECWWSSFRKLRSNWWMNFFKDLVDRGAELSTSNVLQMECLWFSFSPLIQKELDEVCRHWNSHYIRKSRHDTVAGRPDELFYLPECVDAENQLQAIGNAKFQDMFQYCHDYQEEYLYQEYFRTIATHGQFEEPNSWQEALDLYRQLLAIAI